jgi:hypothetical protein
VLEDYYRDSEVYLNELENPRNEISTIKDRFKSSYPENVLHFID